MSLALGQVSSSQMLIDTHCHLNDSTKFTSVQDEIVMAQAEGVMRMILVGVRPEEWSSTLELAQTHEALFCVLGWHPNYTAEYRKDVLDELRRLAQSHRCLAIGEIGLDYHWDFSPRETQSRALEDQLNLAADLDLPVVFHAREAYSDLLDLLETRPNHPYLFHCFAGSQKEADRAMALDSYFGVDGPITYKKSDDLRSVIATLPTNRIVIETDAPYLTPVPLRGKPNRPAYVTHVNQALAEILQIEAERCGELTSKNAIEFFGSKLAG